MDQKSLGKINRPVARIRIGGVFIGLSKSASNRWMAIVGVTLNCAELVVILFLMILGLSRR